MPSGCAFQAGIGGIVVVTTYDLRDPTRRGRGQIGAVEAAGMNGSAGRCKKFTYLVQRFAGYGQGHGDTIDSDVSVDTMCLPPGIHRLVKTVGRTFQYDTLHTLLSVQSGILIIKDLISIRKLS